MSVRMRWEMKEKGRGGRCSVLSSEGREGRRVAGEVIGGFVVSWTSERELVLG